jgi:nuclear polyadenylated RNA-binding protein 3
MDQLDRGFVAWVEGELAARGLKIEVMFLSPRLPLEVVIRRQILEGVLAVSQLDMRSQNSSKIPLQVFDRQAGADNVRFDEYQDLEPKIAAELVFRAKMASIPQAQPTYDSGFSTGQAHHPPPAQPAVANLANLVGQLDNATLQKLLGSISAPQQQNASVATANSGIDLAGLLGGLKPQPPQPAYAPTTAPDPYSNLAANPSLSSLLGSGASQQQAQPQQSAQQVQNIMAQLARFRQ